MGISYRGLGVVAQAQGKHSLAIESLNKSLQIFTEFGSQWDVARVLSGLRQSSFAMGNDPQAEHFWRESLRLSVETQGILTAIEALVGLADLFAKRGDHKYALQLLLISIDHPAAIQEIKIQAGKLAAELREKLASEEIKSTQAFAKGTTFESVVEEILGQARKTRA